MVENILKCVKKHTSSPYGIPVWIMVSNQSISFTFTTTRSRCGSNLSCVAVNADFLLNLIWLHYYLINKNLNQNMLCCIPATSGWHIFIHHFNKFIQQIIMNLVAFNTFKFVVQFEVSNTLFMTTSIFRKSKIWRCIVFARILGPHLHLWCNCFIQYRIHCYDLCIAEWRKIIYARLLGVWIFRHSIIINYNNYKIISLILIQLKWIYICGLPSSEVVFCNESLLWFCGPPTVKKNMSLKVELYAH